GGGVGPVVVGDPGGRRGGVAVQAPPPYRKVLPDGVDRRFVAVPSLKPSPVTRVGHIPGDADLPGARRDMRFKELPVGGDRPGRRRVQAVIGEECYRGRIGQPGPYQGVLTVVITDYHPPPPRPSP